MLFQQILTGLSIGSIYALMAVGYSLIYSLLNFTNFAHSVAVLVGAYSSFYFISLVTDNVFLMVICALVAGGLISMGIEKSTYQPLLNKGAKRIYLLIAGLGLSIIGENLVVVVIDGRFHPIETSFSSHPVNVLGASIGLVDLVIVAVSAIGLIAVELFIQKTKAGLAIRGAAFDLNTAALMGVNTRKLILMVFLIAGVLAGTAGSFMGLKYTAYPTIGNLTTKAFISAVFGGLGSLRGAVVGALLLGVCETLVSAYINSQLRDLFSYGLLIIILLIRPAGLMGKLSDDKA